MRKNGDKLIRYLFIYSFGTFFLSMLTTSLGSLVDGLVIGNTMKTSAVAAFGLINPLNFIFALIGSVLNSGSSSACARALGRNETDRARSMFSITSLAGIGFSAAVMTAILLLTDPILVLLGAVPGTDIFTESKRYLIGYVFGLPAITGTKLLSSVMQLDSDRPRVVVSTFVMTAVNVIGDLLCVFVFHTGLAAIAVVTTLSYYAGMAVLLLHFTRKDIIFRFTFRNPDWKELGNVILKGLPKGVSRVTSALRGIYINRVAVGIAAAAVAGYTVQSNLNFLANSVIMGIAQVFMILISVYYGEENKKAMLRVFHTAGVFELVITGLMSAVLYIFAPFVSRLYLGQNADAYAAGLASVRWYAVGLLFQGYCILFADYLQVTGKTAQANMIYVMEDVLFTVGAVAVLKNRFVVSGIYMGITFAHIIMFLLIPVCIMVINRRGIRNTDDILMLKPGFGVDEDDEFAASITDLDGVMEASKGLIGFCLKKGLDERTAYHLGLAAEEMAANIIEHGFTDGKPHDIDLRAQYREQEGFTLIVRDNCRLFNPKERYRYLSSDDPAANIGLRIIMQLADEVFYTSAMKLNNLTIRLRTPVSGSQPSGEKNV